MQPHGSTFNPWRLFVGSFVPNWLMMRRELSPGAKLLYARLAQFAGKSGTAFPTLGQLAEEMALSDRQVKRYLRELRTNELVRIERAYPHGANRVAFLVHRWMALSEDMTKLAPLANSSPKTRTLARSSECGKPVYNFRANAARRDGNVLSRQDRSVPSVIQDEVRDSKQETQGARGGARNRAAPVAHDGDSTPEPQGGVAALVTNLARSLRTPGAELPGLKPNELGALRVRIDQLSGAERRKLTTFCRWLSRDGASIAEIRSIVGDMIARGDVENPFAYYAPGSEARERLRRANA